MAIPVRMSPKKKQIDLALPQPFVPGNKPIRKAVPVTEAVVLAAVMQTLKAHPRVAWVRRMNTGAGHLARENGGKSQFVRFSFKGCADVIGQLKDGRFLAIEVKAPSGTLRPEQADFLATVNRFGGVAFVARSYEDVQRHLSN